VECREVVTGEHLATSGEKLEYFFLHAREARRVELAQSYDEGARQPEVEHPTHGRKHPQVGVVCFAVRVNRDAASPGPVRQPANRLRELKGEYQQSLGRLAAVTAQLGAIPSSLSPSERAALVAERQQLVGHNQNLLQEISQQTLRVRGPASENFLTDLLTDSDGVSFYRFQIFAWTIVLWVIFIGTVVRTLAMPDFSDQVLGLLGISGGTYLGFKLPKDK